jgi:hypothetical protein
LLQRWFAHLQPGRSPYRLYALSNLGSLLALLTYPFLVERFVRLQAQTSTWSVGYVVFAGLCVACAWRLSGSNTDAVDPVGSSAERPGAGLAGPWLALSACGSGLLMATTNQMSLDIAVVPFLWILPLALYLLTFILCFDSDGWYRRPLFAALLALTLINTVRLLYAGVDLGIMDQVVGYSLTLFVACMCCHGELARMRPHPRHLTYFFLMVSIGGAAGGAFVALAAPAVFPGNYEYPMLLLLCLVLMVFIQTPRLLREGREAPEGMVARVSSWIAWEVVVAAVLVGTYVALRPQTWYGDAPSSNLSAAFATWRDEMFRSLPWMGAAVLLTLELWRRHQGDGFTPWWWSRRGAARLVVSAFVALGLWSFGGALVWQVRESERRTVALGRNFYGNLVVKVRDVGNEDHRLTLTHGRIRHGHQLQEFPTWPTTYYGPETGVGLAIRHHPARPDSTRQFRVGVVGLGVGTLAAYANTTVDPDRDEEEYVLARRGGVPDYMRFYEINPLVIRWADEWFTFLDDAHRRGADVGVFEGDARIVLEGQLRDGDGQRFDVLAVDAFSSDAIPLHLLTEESVRAYLGHLAADGVLAIHVTNRYVDLLPVVARLAEAVGMSAVYIENYESDSRFVSSSDWVLVTNNRAFLDVEAVREDEEPMPEPGPLWTDDFSSIFEVVGLGG